ncbi:MAG: ribose 5-phosphate isomerase B [Sedimentisphaerales bacterium]|nr:ribose 5-phosphate isomerase B [Sedimentisphaerales bacterium]
MKIAIACDHRGYEAKELIKSLLQRSGHEVQDFGANESKSSDYPDYAIPASKAVAGQQADRGILICGSGIGMSITANKIRGIRAALCHDELTAQMSRKHNNANILCLPAMLINDPLVTRIVETWLNTEFEGGRHERRVEKMMAAENICPEQEKAAKPTMPTP